MTINNKVKNELSEGEFLGRHEYNSVCDECGTPIKEIITVGKIIPFGTARNKAGILCDSCFTGLKR